MTQDNNQRADFEDDYQEEEESAYWNKYPLNVQVATVGQKGAGMNNQSKKIFAVFGCIGLIVFMAILGYMAGNKIGLGLLGALVFLFVGIIMSFILYGKITEDKLNKDFESDTNNKILKLFRVRLNDIDKMPQVKGTDLMSYTSGEVFVTMQIEIGNSNDASEAVTAEFLDKVYKAANQLQLKIKNYNTPLQWRKSDIHRNHLIRLTKLKDNKLKSTLANIDEHQSKVYDDCKINSINIAFTTRRTNLFALESLITLVNDWKSDSIYTSSIRRLEWLSHEDTISELCNFLNIDLLDVTNNLNKKTVKYDVRKLVKVYTEETFQADTDVEVESNSILLREAKKRG